MHTSLMIIILNRLSKVKLLRNTVTNEANGILRNTTIAVLLKHLSNF